MKIDRLAREQKFECRLLGQTGGDALVIEGVVDVPVVELGRSYFGSIAAEDEAAHLT